MSRPTSAPGATSEGTMLMWPLSDSHATPSPRRTRFGLARGSSRFVHFAGRDICARPFSMNCVGHPCTFVWGNCDSPRSRSMRANTSNHWDCLAQLPVLELGGKTDHRPSLATNAAAPSPTASISITPYGRTQARTAALVALARRPYAL